MCLENREQRVGQRVEIDAIAVARLRRVTHMPKRAGFAGACITAELAAEPRHAEDASATGSKQPHKQRHKEKEK